MFLKLSCLFLLSFLTQYLVVHWMHISSALMFNFNLPTKVPFTNVIVKYSSHKPTFQQYLWTIKFNRYQEDIISLKIYSNNSFIFIYLKIFIIILVVFYCQIRSYVKDDVDEFRSRLFRMISYFHNVISDDYHKNMRNRVSYR